MNQAAQGVRHHDTEQPENNNGKKNPDQHSRAQYNKPVFATRAPVRADWSARLDVL